MICDINLSFAHNYTPPPYICQYPQFQIPKNNPGRYGGGSAATDKPPHGGNK